MLQSPHPSRSKRRLRLLATLISSVALLAGCANMNSSSQPATGASTTTGVPSLIEPGKSWEQLLEVADTTATKGELGTAAVLYREAHFQRPDAEVPLRRLGPILLKMGHPLEASEAYKSLLALNEKDVEARLGLARSLINLNRPYAASLQFQRLIEAQPDNVESLIGLGVAYDLMGDHEQAQETFRLGLAFAPRNTSLLNNLGHSLTRAGRFDDAIEVLQFAVDQPGTSARHRHNLALAYGLAGKLREAAEMMSHDLDRPSVQQNMAYFRSQQFPRQLSSLARPPVEPVAPPSPPAPAAAEEHTPKPSALSGRDLAKKTMPKPSPDMSDGARATAPQHGQALQTQKPKPAAKAKETPEPGDTRPKAAQVAATKPGLATTPHATARALASGAKTTAAIAPPLPAGTESQKDGKSGTPDNDSRSRPKKVSDKSADDPPARPAQTAALSVAQKGSDGASNRTDSPDDSSLVLLAGLTYHTSPLPSLAASKRSDRRAEQAPVSLFKVSTENSAK